MALYGQNGDYGNGVSTFNRFLPLTQGGQGVPAGMLPVMQSTPNQQYGRYADPCIFENTSHDEKLSHILVKLTNMESVQGTMCKEFENFGSSMKSMHMRVDRLDTCMDIHSKMLKLLAYKSIDNEARGRRNNLIIKGIPEKTDERQRYRGGSRDCVELIQNFLEQEMGHSNPYGELPIERAHRLGKRGYYVNGQYTRPIIVAFQYFADAELIFENAYRLRRTNYSIMRDYPKEIADARKRLYPQFKSARADRKKPIIKYPARLVVNGQTVDDMFPDWYDIMTLDRMSMCHQLVSRPRGRGVYSTSTVEENSSNRDRDMVSSPSSRSPPPPPPPPPPPQDGHQHTLENQIPQHSSVWNNIVNSRMPSGVNGRGYIQSEDTRQDTYLPPPPCPNVTFLAQTPRFRVPATNRAFQFPLGTGYTRTS